MDDEVGTVTFQPGVTAGELLAELTPRGYIVPVASYDEVGVAGFTLGGGLLHLSETDVASGCSCIVQPGLCCIVP